MTSTRPDPNGRVPFRLRIGVTGHRTLSDASGLTACVKAVLDRARELVPGPELLRKEKGDTSILLTVVSSLAEGADRLVAQAVLDADPSADLEAPLPLPVQDYLADFESEESKQRFLELWDEAGVQLEPDAGERPQCYEHVGRYVVDHCDVLVALWDHDPERGRGGTAGIVEYAHRRKVPHFVIDTTTLEVTPELGPGLRWLGEVRQEWRRVNAYNYARVRPNKATRTADAIDNEMMEKLGGLIGGARVNRLADWLKPYMARTGILAERCRTLYLILTALVFWLAAGAVVTVTSQVLFAPEVPELAIIELAMLLGLLLIVALGRWRKISRRFICDRFLAERLREAQYLALAGVDAPRGGRFERTYLGRRPEGWPWRGFGEVWKLRPDAHDIALMDVETLRRVLTDVWIDGQLDYHERSTATNERLHFRFRWGSVALLSITVVAATLHAAGIGHGDEGLSWPNVFVLISIGAPALGGALSGIGAQREYKRHGERSERMVEYLGEVRGDVEAAVGLDALKEAARDAEQLMLAENRDWFGIVSFHDLEPHS